MQAKLEQKLMASNRWNKSRFENFLTFGKQQMSSKHCLWPKVLPRFWMIFRTTITRQFPERKLLNFYHFSKNVTFYLIKSYWAASEVVNFLLENSRCGIFDFVPNCVRPGDQSVVHSSANDRSPWIPSTFYIRSICSHWKLSPFSCPSKRTEWGTIFVRFCDYKQYNG